MNSDRFQNLELAAPVAAQATAAFVMCPISLPNGTGSACPWEQVYRLAYERAQAVVRPSILQRLQANLLN